MRCDKKQSMRQNQHKKPRLRKAYQPWDLTDSDADKDVSMEDETVAHIIPNIAGRLHAKRRRFMERRNSHSSSSSSCSSGQLRIVPTTSAAEIKAVPKDDERMKKKEELDLLAAIEISKTIF